MRFFSRKALRTRAALFACAASAGFSVACGDNDSVSPSQNSASQVWVGSVSGTDIAVGLAQNGSHATLFFCGGSSSFQTSTHWFTGTIDASAPFTFSANGVEATGNVDANGVAGMLSGDPQGDNSFQLNPPASGTLSGVYDAIAPCGHIGLIVRQADANSAPLAQGTCLKVVNGSAVVEQVNPVMPLTRDADSGVAVTLDGDTSETFVLHPLTPAG